MKKQEKSFKLFVPEMTKDIEEVVANLLDEETSILVNLSKSTCKKEVIDKVIQYVENSSSSYMIIKTKRVFKRVFVAYSVRNRII